MAKKKGNQKNAPSKDNKKAIVSEATLTIIEKLLDPEKSRRIIHEYGKITSSPEVAYIKGAEILRKKLEGGDMTEEDNKKFNDIVMGTNITGSHRMLAEVVTEDRDRMAMVDMTDEIIKEYDCKTVSERALCEIIVNGYTQILKINRRMTSTMNAGEYLSNERTLYINVLSRELERANRSYLNALHTLRSIKSPNLNIHIKTNTAIVGTNQQFNNNLPPNEIIEA